MNTDILPKARGRYTENAPLGSMGWFRAGGKAEMLYKPADLEDLQDFLRQMHEMYPPHPATSKAQAPNSSHPSPRGGEGMGGGANASVPINIFGVMSNSIIRDGGVKGVVIRLGKEFAQITTNGDTITAGALALDGNVAMAAAKAGIAGLEFYSGIPGTIGGALRMNAGCYGTETKDVLIEARALDKQGNLHRFKALDKNHDPESIGPGGSRVFVSDFDEHLKMDLSYRHNSLPHGFIFIGATFNGEHADPEEIKNNIQEIKTRRSESQPIREKTGGSTFANPPASEIEKAGLPEGTKVWQLIDQAGCRGLRVGGAQMSEKHCNFMINTGDASAADLENLGEEVRRRVKERYGITLRWEVRRIGEALNG